MQFDDNMSLDQAVPKNTKYLGQDDVGAGITVTIQGLTLEPIETDNGGTENKAVLNFVGDFKPLVLNQTNKELLKAVTGEVTAGGIKGKRITVYTDPTVMFGGKAVGGLRIKQADPGSPSF